MSYIADEQNEANFGQNLSKSRRRFFDTALRQFDFFTTQTYQKQEDELFIENCLRDRDVMIPLMRKNVQDHLNFDQSVFDEETANRLLQKYQRHEMYTKDLIDEFYGDMDY